jgi:hypothetical protein
MIAFPAGTFDACPQALSNAKMRQRVMKERLLLMVGLTHLTGMLSCSGHMETLPRFCSRFWYWFRATYWRYECSLSSAKIQLRAGIILFLA